MKQGMENLKGYLTINLPRFEDPLAGALLRAGGVDLVRWTGEEPLAGMDFLIADRPETFDLLPPDAVITRILLVDDAEQERLEEPPYQIYRFESARMMAGKIRVILGKEHWGPYPVQEGEADAMAFLAPEGGAGTTSFAMAFGTCLYRLYGERCLYVSLSPFNRREPLGGFVDTAFRENYLRTLHRLSKGLPLAKEVAIWEGDEMDAIRVPPFNGQSSAFAPVMDVALRRLAGSLGYAHILYDIGDHVEGMRKGVAEGCGTVFAVTGHVEQGQRLLEELVESPQRRYLVYNQGACGCARGSEVPEDGGYDLGLPRYEEMGKAALSPELCLDVEEMLRQLYGEEPRDRWFV